MLSICFRLELLVLEVENFAKQSFVGHKKVFYALFDVIVIYKKYKERHSHC